MKRKIISIILVAVMTISCSTVANAAEKNTVSVEKSSMEFDDVWQEYKNDEQFNLMLKEYGKECAESFIWDVIAHREEEREFENNKTRGGGGNICYQYVTNIKQTETYNCGPTTVLQTLYGMSAAQNVPGSSNAEKIATLNTVCQVSASTGTSPYNVTVALNTYKPKGIGNYVYARGTSVTEYGFESTVATSLTACRPVVLHALTGSLTYYNGKNSKHYLSLDYIDRTNDVVRIVDGNYNSAYYGVHNQVPLSEAYKCVAQQDRYFIY